MKILITGESGFIGRHVALRLRADGHELVSMGRRGPIVADFSGDFEIPDLSGFDVFLHLAGHAHAPNSSENELLHQAVNFRATERLIAAAKSSGIARVLFLSSIAVYGEPTAPGETAIVWSEETKLEPRTGYGESKLQAEQAVTETVRGTKTSYIILRLPMVYGPNAPGNFSLLLKLVRKGLPIPVGLFENRRSFLYIENLVDAVSRIVAEPSIQNEIFNVADGDVVSTTEFADLMAEGLNEPSRVRKVPSWLLAPFVLLAGQRERFRKLVGTCEIDSSKIRRILKWTPPYTTRSGVLKSVRDDIVKS